MPTAGRLLLLGTAVLLGLVSGLVGSFAHGYTSYHLPLGLLAGLALSVAVFVTAGIAARSRAGAALASGGWLLTVLVLSLPRPEGDLVVPGTLLGYAWLFGGTLLAGVAVSWPYGQPPRDGHAADDAASGAPPARR